MNVDEALLTRRSVKHFDPAVVIDDETLRDLIRPVLYTPTSFNLQHWRFVLVRDQARKDALCKAAYNQVQVRDASLVALIVGKLDAHVDAARVWQGAPDRVQASMRRTIDALYAGDAGLQRDEAVRSGAMASMALLLRATELGFATCPLIGFDDAEVRRVLGIPADYVSALLICVGRAVAEPHPRVGRFGIGEVVRLEHFDGEPLADGT